MPKIGKIQGKKASAALPHNGTGKRIQGEKS